MDINPTANTAPSNPAPAISLSKGGNISLSKNIATDPKFVLGLGWDARSTDGADFDLDASAFLLGANGKITRNEDFVFYNSPKHPSGAVTYNGDNLTGEGDGDDETINLDFSLVPDDIEKIAITVSIHEGTERGQNFGQVTDAYVQLHDSAGEIPFRFDLSEDASLNTAVIFGEFYKKNGEWKFKAIEQGWESGLQGLLTNFS